MAHLKKHRIWLDKYEKREGEEMPHGLVLCSEKSYERMDLLRLEESGIHVARIPDTTAATAAA